MNDTVVTIVGNALTQPEWRKVEKHNTVVVHFKIAATSRRYDKDSERWVDGPSLRVRVNCWRRLAEHVNQSVMVGDPIVVHGRLYTRDWVTEDGQHRTMYELEAMTVGHDLNRGTAKFTRVRPSGSAVVVEDADTDARVGGERSVSLTRPDAPGPASLAVVDAAPLEPVDEVAEALADAEMPDDPFTGVNLTDTEVSDIDDILHRTGDGTLPVPADLTGDDDGNDPPSSRPRRNRGRLPVSA